MLVVDAQIHLWRGAGAPPHHSLGRTTYSYEDALRDMAEAGVSAAINCPPVWDKEANLYAVEAASANPGRFATLDWLDLTEEDSRAQLIVVARRPGVIGLRFLTASTQNPADPKSIRLYWPEDDRLDWVWRDSEANAIPVCLFGPALFPHIRSIAERHPGLKITIDHYAVVGPRTSDGKLNQMEDLGELARLPNVAIKVTGGPSYANDGYPFLSMHDPIKRLYDMFGPERLFWGTDITRLTVPWRQCIEMFTEHMPWLNQHDLRLIMGEAVCAWHEWRPTAAEWVQN